MQWISLVKMMAFLSCISASCMMHDPACMHDDGETTGSLHVHGTYGYRSMQIACCTRYGTVLRTWYYCTASSTQMLLQECKNARTE
jgi:hypothetical protein